MSDKPKPMNAYDNEREMLGRVFTENVRCKLDRALAHVRKTDMDQLEATTVIAPHLEKYGHVAITACLVGALFRVVELERRLEAAEKRRGGL